MKLTELRGSWALITGATAGIGKAFAEQLASQGINLVLLARRHEKLIEIGEQLEKKFSIRFLTFSIDLAAPDYPQYITQIHSQLTAQGIKIRILCNIAGISYFGYFTDHTTQELEQLIRLNVSSVVFLCRDFLPDLMSHPTSVIINISSQCALQPTPYMAAYSGTKSFIQNFSMALWAEYQSRGVYVQTLIPGPTKTESTLKNQASGNITNQWKLGPPEDVVKASFKGIEEEKLLVTNVEHLAWKRLLVGVVPIKIVVQEVAKLFKPQKGVRNDQARSH